MSKTKLYYWVMAILLLIFFVASFVNVSISNSSNLEYSKLEQHIKALNALNALNTSNPNQRNSAVRDYIVQELDKIGIANQSNVTDTQIDNDYSGVDWVDNGPTFVVQESTINRSVSQSIASESGVHYAGTTVNNVVVGFPSNEGESNNVVVFFVSYDAPLSVVNGAMTTNADVAVMLETIAAFNSMRGDHGNDVAFVFGQNNTANLGLHAFVRQFRGLGQLGPRATLAVGLRGVGANGVLALVDSSDNNSALLSKVGLSGTASSSFGTQFASQLQRANDIVGINIPYAVFGNIGDLSWASSPNDDNIDKGVVQAKAGLLRRVVDNLKSADIESDTLQSSTNKVHFNYFGINIALSSIFYIILAVLLLLGVIGVLVLGVYRKAFVLGNILKAACLQILVLASVVLASVALYFVFAWLLLVAYNVIPLDLVAGFTFYNPGLLIAFILLGLAISNAIYNPFKKLFRVRAVDIVKANVLMLCIGASIVAFVNPLISYPFVWLGLMQLIVMLLNVLYKDKFKTKYNRDIEKMFFYIVPVVLTLPLTIPAMIAVAQVVPLPAYSFLAASSVVLFGFGLPFLSFVKPVFDKGLQKLPSYYVTEVSIVEQKVEHKAKKGRYSIQKVKQKTKSPRKLKYHTAFGTGLVAVVAAIMVFASATPATTFGARVDSGQYNNIYRNAIVLNWERRNSVNTLGWIVKDNSAFRTFDNARSDSGYSILEGFGFDNGRNAFWKEESNSQLLASQPEIRTNEGYEFYPASPNTSYVELVAKDASNVREFEIVVRDQTMFRIANPNRQDTVRISLPFGFGNLAQGGFFKIISHSIVGNDNQGVTWDYVEYSYNENELSGFELWASLTEYFETNRPQDNLRGGIVYSIIQ
jgi:hypothetical protein